MPPMAMRWRWRADDEMSWTACASGCCEMEDVLAEM
jgi:hypothetical protein